MGARVSVEELRPARAGERPRAGAPARSAAALVPRDAGGVLDLALEGLVARIGPCLALAVALHLLQGLVLPGGGVALLLQSWAWALPFLLPLAATSFVVSLVGDALEDPARPLGPALWRGLTSAPGSIALLFLTSVLTAPLLLALVVPYFLVLWRTWPALPLFVLEGEDLLDPAERERARANPLARLASLPRRMGRALARGWSLSRGSAAFGRWVLLAVVGQLLLAGLLDLGATALTYPEAREFLRTGLGLGPRASALLIALVSALFLGLAGCVRAALMVAYAHDLRVRREGRDLELWLERAQGAH